MPDTRPVFYVSDGTGITAETIGHSLLTQFPGVGFASHRIPFLDTPEAAARAAERIRQAGEACGHRPIVVNTIVNPAINQVLAASGALMVDVFAPFVGQLAQEFGIPAQPRVGQAHGIVDFNAYEQRMNATNYALTHDDGVDVNYDEADVILVGVSRSGKTPTCLYMALHYGVSAANYPLTDGDLEALELPKRLRPHRHKLYGLTIDPARLQQIRQQRKPGSRYATLEQCRSEVAAGESLFRHERLPVLNTTHTSIEEIASKVLAQLGIERALY
jgi:regulator of PEP synthase PpsR (kinase-PPPase family)